VEKGLAPT